MVNNPFQYNVFDRIKGFFLQKSALSRLMLINIVVWIVVMFVNVLTWLFAKNNTSLMLDWFAVPANLATLAHRPWTVFTYMFLQEGFGHLFFNMLVLYFGGVIFCSSCLNGNWFILILLVVLRVLCFYPCI